MNCTEKERETCNVEKLGCTGCAYNKKIKKVMISQPMNERTEDVIKEERNNIKKAIEVEGIQVIDTIFAEEAPKDIDTAIYYLAKSIEAIGKVDGVIFARGWEKARGCRIEHQVAVEYGKELFYIN